MGIVRAYQKGTLKGKATPEVQGAASSMKKKDVKKFASTKHKGLPEKKVTKESFNEDAKMAKQSDDKLKAAHQKFSSMDKSPANTFMLKRIQREMNKRKKNVHYSMKEDYVKELEDGLVKMEYPAYDEVDKLMQKIAKENDIDTTTLHMAFKTKHLMVPDDWAKRKMMEPVMIPKTPEGINEDDGNYFMNKIAKEKGLDLTDPRQRRRANSLARHNAAKGNVNNPAGFSKRKKKVTEELDKNDKPFVKKLVGKLRKGSKTHAKQADDLEKAMNEEQNPEGMKYSDAQKIKRQEQLKTASKKAPIVTNKIVPTNKLTTEGSLHKWFKGSKSKDGKGGWVNVVTGGTCASDEPGEGTPKCVSSSKRASMTKAERLSASRRKKKADPGQQSKSGAAKPTYVSTDKPKKVDEAYGGRGSSRMARLKSIHPPTAKAAIKNIPDDESDRGSGNKAAKRAGKKVEKKSPTYRAYVLNKEDVEGRKTALTDTKTKDVRLARKKDSEIRREAERSMYDTSAGESEIARRTRIAKKLRGSTIAKNQEKGKQMEIDTTKKLVGEGIKRDEYGDPIGGPKISKKKLKKNLKRNTPDEDHTTTTAESYSSKPSNQKKKAKLTAALDRLENLKVQKKMNEEAWQRKEGKNQSGGLNEKGRKSYERANPGSDLKAPSKKKGNKRRKSFCARMKGMKSKLTSAKTARDPDSRINKSLRAWNCSYEPENGEIISESNHKKVAKMIKTLKRKTRVLEKGQKRDAGAIAAKIMREKEHNKYVNFLPMDEEKKKCGDGEYYCNDDKKCKPIPKGYKVGYGGYLKPENNDESNGKKGGSNGNGNGNGSHGNGHGGNGNGGNGGGNGGGE